MRTAGRLLLALAVLLILGACAVLLFRKPIAEAVIERAAAGAGVEAPAVQVAALTTRGITLRLDSAGPSARVEVDYDLGTLITERRVEAVTVKDARASVRVGPDGVHIQGVTPQGGSGGGELPFDRLIIEDASIALMTPEGPAEGAVSGRFVPGEGGEGRLRFEAARAGTADFALEDGVLEGTVSLSKSGEARTEMRLAGDLFTPLGVARGARLRAEGSASEWQSWPNATRGQGRVVIEQVAAAAAENAVVSRMSEGLAQIGTEAERLSLEGAIEGVVENGQVRLFTSETGFLAQTPNGERLRIASPGDAPLLVWSEGTGRLVADWDATLSAGAGAGHVRIALEEGGIGAVEADAALPRLSLYGVETVDLSAKASGVWPRLDLALTAARARAEVAGTDLRTQSLTVPLTLDASAGVVLRLEDGECASAPSLTASLPGETMVTLDAVRLCAGEAPLWADGAAAGVITAKTARTTLGALDVAVREPSATARMQVGEVLRFVAQVTAPRAALGDAMALNEVRLTADGTAADAGPDVRITLERAVLAQTAAAPAVAPVTLAGAGRVTGETAQGSLTAKSKSGVLLGDASLRHDLETSSGMARFETETLSFTPDGLQPQQLAPALRGLVSAATGSLSATTEASWSEAGAKTAGTASLDGLSFRGPGVAVARTAGLSGEWRFDSLMPLRTAGAQPIRVDLLDLRALKLADGRGRFVLPGDGSLVVEEASFPWFGGTLRTTNATADVSGDLDAVLTAEGVEIGEALAYLDVDGLSGEGKIGGTLPLKANGFAVRIEDGHLAATTPGVIRYEGAKELAQTNQQTKLAFGALEDLRFSSLSATVQGPLDGELDFGLRFEGTSELDLGDKRVPGRVKTPIIYRLNIEAPVLSLIEQARLSTDVQRQIEQAIGERSAQP
ncbi:intermembrane phospholipid transport protein YdbH family protein [Parvularcula dongshanensis]|uniref:Dicarboxylate transport domain-containing protein n=1 Tax=Parvularcula dongshanensis TaxID=1173995 RepID=A0A840I5B8_9PROT|nr:YdbH domain-containing protein [Parvularcula dongshanensis]MBB4659473.1 hypothetical protein [Parvularcula dongshanensis]